MTGVVGLHYTYAEIPSVKVTQSSTTINEGETVNFSVKVVNYPYTQLYWYSSGTTNSSDFSTVSSGYFDIINTIGSFYITAKNDLTTEGTESFKVFIQDPTTGNIVAESQSIVVYDSSTTPPMTVSISPSTYSINEGQSVTFTVTVANYPYTSFYWRVDTNSIITASDFTATSGTVSLVNNTGTFTVTAASDITTEGTESFTVSIRQSSSSSTDLATCSPITIYDTSIGPTNQTFYSSGTWTCPSGVYSVNVLCIGGGGGGGRATSPSASYTDGGGGGGGGLGWKNSISVSPGTTYSVVVGNGGSGSSTNGASGGNGGVSYFINTSTVRGGGGSGGYGGSYGGYGGGGGDYIGDGGGNGGSGGGGSYGQLRSGGGGGAGGFSGAGGTGGTGSTTAQAGYAGTANSGAAGGGSSGTKATPAGGGAVPAGGAGGGGVGTSGKSTTGSATSVPTSSSTSATTYGGRGGSGGGNGGSSTVTTTVSPGSSGGSYGGGGGGSGSNVTNGGNGSSGVVRIIWNTSTSARWPAPTVF